MLPLRSTAAHLLHTLPGNYVAFSPHGSMLATGAGNTLRLWNIGPRASR